MQERLSRRSAFGHRRIVCQISRNRIPALVVAIIILCVPVLSIQPPDAAYLQSFEKWKSELVDDLKQNWLVLAGLFWLKPGGNTFGSGCGDAIVLPWGLAHCGVFHVG